MNEFLTTRELADLLRIKERKVYDLAASGDVPCSRATGKLLFPRKQIDAWLAASASGGRHTVTRPRPNVMVGSHDPLLEWALRESRCGLASYFDSSLDGLARFSAGDGVATGLHVYDPVRDDWNVPAVSSRFADLPVVLVRWATRQRGIIVRPDADEHYQSLADLSGCTMVPRQAEAGSQVLLEALLVRDGIDPAGIHWTNTARSEVDAVLAVQEQKADAAFGLAALATQYRLGFVPVIEEHFDLLVDRRAWFETPWQTLIAFCRSDEFMQRAAELAGYSVNEQFSVRYNSL